MSGNRERDIRSEELKHLNEQRTDSPIPTPAITEELLQELRRLEAEATAGGVYLEPDDSAAQFSLTERWRLISTEKRHDWDRYNTTARVPYMATIYSRAEALYLHALRNAAPLLLAAAARLKETEAVVAAATSLVTSIRRHGFQYHVLSPEGQHLAMCVDALTSPARPLPESQR